MSAIMDKHARWTEARSRLGMNGVVEKSAPSISAPHLKLVERWAYHTPAPYDAFDPQPYKPLWRTILKQVAEKHGVSMADLLSPRRNTGIVIARHELMYRLKTETTLSHPQIGRRINKDQSSIAFGANRHAQRNGLEMFPSEFMRRKLRMPRNSPVDDAV